MELRAVQRIADLVCETGRQRSHRREALLLLQAFPLHALLGNIASNAEDDDGPQPLVALWRVMPLRGALHAALASGDHAVHALQRRLGMGPVRLTGVRFGNLNTPEDLRSAGIEPA